MPKGLASSVLGEKGLRMFTPRLEVRHAISGLLLWLVMDSNIWLPEWLAPQLFGLAMGRKPHRVRKAGGKQ